VGWFRRRKYKVRNHKASKVEQLRKRRYNQKYHGTLEEGVRKKKNQGELRNKKSGGLLTPKENISKIQHMDIKPQIELVGEEIGTTK
jgi:hypothetical protein